MALFCRLKQGQTILQKKGRGRLVHASEYINPETGRLIYADKDGNILDEARKIIYPGSNGDAWWDSEQLLKQAEKAVVVFEKQFPGCIALFIFDQSSAHGSLSPDTLKAFEMNKSDGGKQRKQKDTIIPESNPHPTFRGLVQKMTMPNGDAKGLQRVLEERGFNICGKKAKCKPICQPDWNKDCCMACLLSNQDDFANQISQLETLIRAAGHECIFLPKFHCEMNPIEMASTYFFKSYTDNTLLKICIMDSIGGGQNFITGKYPSQPLQMLRMLNMSVFEHGKLNRIGNDYLITIKKLTIV